MAYRGWLSEFIRANPFASIVDVGCGDWQMSAAIDWTGIKYLGVDLVPNVIAENRRRFTAPDV